MNLTEIKEQLDWGDMQFIAKNTGFSISMVKKVLSGDRKNDTIVSASKLLIQGKKSLSEQISIMCGEELDTPNITAFENSLRMAKVKLSSSHFQEQKLIQTQA